MVNWPVVAPIGSGPVEGACKNLIKDRMERSGMRWIEPAAVAVPTFIPLRTNAAVWLSLNLAILCFPAYRKPVNVPRFTGRLTSGGNLLVRKLAQRSWL
jgi:hypothetical protein